MFKPETEYYIFAAGTYGRRLINFLRDNAPSLKIIAFIDNDQNKQGTIYQGLPVISWDKAKENVPRVKIIISLSLPTQLRDFLLAKGYKENDDFYSEFSFLPRYFWAIEKKIVTPNVLIFTNNNCVCNCDGCYAYIPYVKKPFVCSLESFKKTADLMFKHFDKCLNINIVGGETLLNKSVADLCVYLRENYAHKFGTMNIATSGILIPSDEEMKKFAFAKTEFSLSDYVQTDERAAKNFPLLIEKCREFNVHCYRDRQCDREVWFDLGDPYKINITDPEELKSNFNKCFKTVTSCLDGKLFGCFMQHWRWLATGISEPQDDDAFDLNQDVTEQSRELLYKIISYQPKLGYHTGCAHCGGTFTPYLTLDYDG
jgi:hypothetical protein